jgi:hypothetical protein
MKTGCVALVLCLNIGVDPPDVIKISPCARMECWIGKRHIFGDFVYILMYYSTAAGDIAQILWSSSVSILIGDLRCVSCCWSFLLHPFDQHSSARNTGSQYLSYLLIYGSPLLHDVAKGT